MENFELEQMFQVMPAWVRDIKLGSQQVTLEFHNGSKELINNINAQIEDGDAIWSFKGIKGHRKRNKKWEVLVSYQRELEAFEWDATCRRSHYSWTCMKA